jgi:uncharacterized membrane protein YebE (DUF533 family)
MAIRDVKQYYYSMLGQYLEMKADLQDFEQALADGYITEDKLESIREEVNLIETNYERLSYIMYLLEMPKRPQKKAKFSKTNKALEEYFSNQAASEQEIKIENNSALDQLRKKLKELKEVGI